MKNTFLVDDFNEVKAEGSFVFADRGYNNVMNLLLAHGFDMVQTVKSFASRTPFVSSDTAKPGSSTVVPKEGRKGAYFAKKTITLSCNDENTRREVTLYFLAYRSGTYTSTCPSSRTRLSRISHLHYQSWEGLSRVGKGYQGLSRVLKRDKRGHRAVTKLTSALCGCC